MKHKIITSFTSACVEREMVRNHKPQAGNDNRNTEGELNSLGSPWLSSVCRKARVLVPGLVTSLEVSGKGLEPL